VGPYSRPQIWVLLAVVALGGMGVAVGGWRRAHPDLAEHVERFDSETTPAADPRLPVPSPRAEAGRAASHAGGGHAQAPGRGDLAREASPPRRTGPPGAARAAKRQASEGPLDLNRATPGDLERLPGVGPALAARILTARQQSGRFESIDDLRAVPGIGEAKLGRLRDLVTVAR
jgi:competence ComEA-like helix-hairpin-helix protein